MFSGLEMSYVYEAERPRGAAERHAADRRTGELFAALGPKSGEQHPHIALPLIRAIRVL
jgi:hypothetical protein